MKKNKIFFKQISFYMSIFSLILVIVALALYSGNCASEFNGEKVSAGVVAADVVAIIFFTLAIAACVLESFAAEKPLLSDILKYRRVCLYVAFLALIYSFLMGILAEYSLIGTILYPIVSGTVGGDPVDKLLSYSYFAQLICTFVAMGTTLASALMLKHSYYKNNIDRSEKSMEAGVRRNNGSV